MRCQSVQQCIVGFPSPLLEHTARRLSSHGPEIHGRAFQRFNSSGACISTASTGLAAKHVTLLASNKRKLAAIKARVTRLQRERSDQQAPARTAPSAYNQHHDLSTFLDYVEEYGLKTNTTVFKGTLYEYTVAEALKPFDMVLKRVGKSDDRGVDLIGQWNLPAEPPSMRMLVQCKMSKTTPSLIRELEGAYTGAPSGWDGDNVFAVLASRHAASPGTQQAIQRSKCPLGFLQVDFDGLVKQFVWNQAAVGSGLAGVGVTSRFDIETEDQAPDEQRVDHSIALTWLGEPWPLPGS